MGCSVAQGAQSLLPIKDQCASHLLWLNSSPTEEL